MSKKNKKKRKLGKSLNERFREKALKKAAKQGKHVFVCEAHAHFPKACGHQFTSKRGHVACPKCHNPYCRWLNYQEPQTPFAS